MGACKRIILQTSFHVSGIENQVTQVNQTSLLNVGKEYLPFETQVSSTTNQ